LDASKDFFLLLRLPSCPYYRSEICCFKDFHHVLRNPDDPAATGYQKGEMLFFFSCGEGKEILFDMRIDHPPWTEKESLFFSSKARHKKIGNKDFQDRCRPNPLPFHSFRMEILGISSFSIYRFTKSCA